MTVNMMNDSDKTAITKSKIDTHKTVLVSGNDNNKYDYCIKK